MMGNYIFAGTKQRISRSSATTPVTSLIPVMIISEKAEDLIA